MTSEHALEADAPLEPSAAADGAAEYRAAPALFAHPFWLARASSVLGAPGAAQRLAASDRVGARFNAVIHERFELDPTPEDMSSDGRAFLIASPARLEARLLLLGAVSNGPALRKAVSRLAVAALAAVLGERDLRAAVRAGEAGTEDAPLDTSSPQAIRARFADSASRHFAAWLCRQPDSLRKRALLALPADSDLAPRSPAKGDPDFIPALTPLALRLDAEFPNDLAAA